MNFRGVIAEDEELLRTALSSLLKETWPQMEIVAECEDGASALESIAELQPDVAHGHRRIHKTFMVRH